MRWSITFALIFLISSCGLLPGNKSDESDVLAKVEDSYLYKSDLDGLIMPGTSAEDSVAKVKAFVEDWIRQTLLLKKAEFNLAKEMKNFDKQLENYRNSLIIYRYQELLVSQQLDTMVTEEEIINYYNGHKEDFELRKNIIKASYVIFSKSTKERDKVKLWFTTNNGDNYEKLEKFCVSKALKYSINDTNWIYFDDLEKDIPLQYSSQELFLSSKKNIEIEDSSLVYLLKIHDYKIKESLSPLEFEKRRIYSIILNIRKRELLRKAEEDIFKEGIEQKKFEVFIQ